MEETLWMKRPQRSPVRDFRGMFKMTFLHRGPAAVAGIAITGVVAAGGACGPPLLGVCLETAVPATAPGYGLSPLLHLSKSAAFFLGQLGRGGRSAPGLPSTGLPVLEGCLPKLLHATAWLAVLVLLLGRNCPDWSRFAMVGCHRTQSGSPESLSVTDSAGGDHSVGKVELLLRLEVRSVYTGPGGSADSNNS